MHSISCEILDDSKVLCFCVMTGAGPPKLSVAVPAAFPAHLHPAASGKEVNGPTDRREKKRESHGESALDKGGPLLRSEGPRRGPPYLVLDVGVDSLQHPLTGVLIGQVGVYLWEGQADTWGGRRSAARGLATLRIEGRDLGPTPRGRRANHPPTSAQIPCSRAQAPQGPGQVTPTHTPRWSQPHRAPPTSVNSALHLVLGCDTCPSHSQPSRLMLPSEATPPPGSSPKEHFPPRHLRLPQRVITSLCLSGFVSPQEPGL